MDEQMSKAISYGVATAILDKYIDPILKKMAEGARKNWGQFRVDFDIAFKKYSENAYNKYSKIKTILYRVEPKYIYDFFVTPTLQKKEGQFIEADSVAKITDVSNFVLIQGTGGIGKSTLLKHLFINELSNHDLIPIFIELKDINDAADSYEIEDFIFERLTNLGTKLDKDCLRYALQSGCFLFLMDGYDEVLTDKKNVFLKKLDAFCDRYATNHFILTSRPCSDFIELQRFTVLQTCPLSKKQAVLLIKKADFDQEVKNRFAKELEEKLYEEHESFASNPLLLNIMLLTYDNYAEIPAKLHLFYAKAFETLYAKHDATKAGYRRELRCKLPYDEFKKVFAYFCYITYMQGKLEFTRDELLDTLKKIKVVTFNPELYIYDLVNAVCVLYKEGFNYRFSHRSFQEYFTAVFLKELTDENMKLYGLKTIRNDTIKAIQDAVFPMLRDMAEEKFERNILLPIIEEVEGKTKEEDKLDLYFNSLISEIEFMTGNSIGKENVSNFLVVGHNPDAKIVIFLERFTNPYYNMLKEKPKFRKTRELYENLKSIKTEVHMRFTISEIKENAEIRSAFIHSIVAKDIIVLSQLHSILTEKLKREELDLADLIPD